MRITSPAEVTDPNDGGVLTNAEVNVRCEVLGDADESSVRIEMLHEDDELNEEANAARVGQTDEFAASFVVATIPNGPVSFRCSAAASGDPSLVGSDEIETFVDHGPNISVIEPAIDGAYQLVGAIRFEFTVEPSLLAEGDDGAEVQDVSLSVLGVNVDELLDETDPGTYVASVDFMNEMLFPEPPTGTVTVAIRATNSREPSPVQASLIYEFVIDSEGPEITIIRPLSGSVVGGQTPLVFEVKDTLAGVDETSVVLELDETEYRFTDGEGWTRLGDEFTYTFNATQLGASQYQSTINISATDRAQNESREGASAVYYLDNVPPIVDLDPGFVREYDLSEEVCSRAFDPLGESPNDLSQVRDVTAVLRALVWEQTNDADGASMHYYAGTNPDKVTIYLQPDPTKPLLVDGDDADDICDSLDVVLDEETGDELPRNVLVPIPPDGASWFLQPDAGHPDLGAAPSIAGICDYGLSDPEPDPLCNPPSSDLTRVISQVVTSSNEGVNDSTIYGVGQLNDLACTGLQWQIAQFLNGDGWICMAARAEDFANNVGVSTPLRLCYDDPDVAGSPPCLSGTNPPTCTDGCTLPRRYPSSSTDSTLELGPSILVVP